tara:strand:+ start:3228 stop:4691 length:1464 start_codon:yes stop_codon:yes gene_type:complete
MVTAPKVNEKVEWLKCRMSLLYYLSNYVLIQDRIRQEVVPWQAWGHLCQLVELIQVWADREVREPLFIIIFKSRQVGASTTITGIGNWLAGFYQSTKVIMQSQRAREAAEMLDRARFINEHLPTYLRMKILPNQDDIMGYPGTNGQIRSLPSTEEAGRSTDATMVVCDEWDFHFSDEEKERDAFASIKPTMTKGGIFIGVSTIDKTRKNSLPQQIYLEACKGMNSFIPLFWDYFVVPGRTEETWQRDTMGLPDFRKEAEYPRNEKEAFSPPKRIGFFNHDTLEKMLMECRDPVEVRYGGLARIFVPSITTRRFILVIDPSEGQADPSVGIVADIKTGEDVACFNGWMSLDEQAKIALEFYRYYNEPLVVVERNASGLTLIEKLRNLGVTNWYYSDKEKRKEGWYTASHGINREKILNDFAEAIQLRQKRTPIKDCILELFNFAWIEGRPQAIKGKHDDWVMCESILEQVRRTAPSGGIQFSSLRYKV